jgi:2-amino-4-hydroxy-6-hydroxymethyldihydropteridine diphosphokinase
MKNSTVYISIGTNIEPRNEYIKKAVEHIEKLGSDLKISSIYETEPFGFKAETKFYNAALKMKTTHTPLALLKTLLDIEKAMGRKRNTANKSYQSREIDIDIIAFDRQVIISKQLNIPHPEFRKRKFVLVPLNEIAPDWIDPLTQKNVSQLLKESQDKDNPNLIEKW